MIFTNNNTKPCLVLLGQNVIDNHAISLQYIAEADLGLLQHPRWSTL